MASLSSIYNRNQSGVAQSFSASPLQGKTTNPSLKSIVSEIPLPQLTTRLKSFTGDVQVPDYSFRPAPDYSSIMAPSNQTVPPPTQTELPPTQTELPPTQTVPQPTQTQQSYSSEIPMEYINPKTGTFYKMEDFAPQQQYGDIPQYAGDTLTEGNQTSEQLAMRAANLGNARNDIATGASDPYKVASESGIPYSPEEMRAIEKAYAGIYDPAINSALEKLNKKQEEDLIRFRTDEDIRQYRATTEQAGIGGSGAVYVEGANPVVDGWVQRLNQSGQSIEAAIPGVKNQALRDAVMLGLNASKSKNAKMSGTLDDINTISTMLANPKLENISGFMDQTVGGLFGQAKTAKTQYNQIVGALQLAKAGQIKGQGQISDYERKVLKEASAAVDRGMNDEEFKKALVKLRGVLQTSSGLEAKVKIIDPSNGQSDVQYLNTEEINGFIQDGAIIEYLE